MTARVNGAMLASVHKTVYEMVLSHYVSDGIAAPNVESILSHVRFLRQVAGKDKARGVSATEADKLDIAICEELSKMADQKLPSSETPYHQLAAWAGSINRAFPVEFFTTNYDLLLEEAMEANRVPFFDGFVGSKSSFLDLQAMEGDALPARWARLWKIHGSLNWGEDKSGNIYRGSISGLNRRLIYPSHLKYDESRRMPYLAMLDRLRAFLKQSASVLIVSGFSFGDENLNEIIVQGLQGNSTAAVFALMYGSLNSYPNLVDLARNRANLSVLAFDQAVIGTRLGEWIKGTPPGYSQNPLAIQWIDDPAVPGTKKSVLLLPDFRALAAFAADLVGQPRVGI
ncbi:MAG TPA: SIR2 family protein [Candidatus Angelobacter sp.]|jgi:hypothetical protein